MAELRRQRGRAVRNPGRRRRRRRRPQWSEQGARPRPGTRSCCAAPAGEEIGAAEIVQDGVGRRDAGTIGIRVDATVRNTRAPSFEARSASSDTVPSSVIVASAPQGIVHPPPSSRRNARSASSARCRSGSSIGARASRVTASSARHSTASAPCPTMGSITATSRTSVARSERPSRSSAAAATTTAACSDAFSTRVGTLPRSSAKRRSGRMAASCARRRTEPVPILPPRGIAASVEPTSASRTSARSGTAASSRSSGVTAMRSLAECTARSASPRRTTSWTSLTNTPFPPRVWIALVRSRSPWVETMTSSVGRPSRAATRSACQRASTLPRVAIRTEEVILVRRGGRTATRARPSRARRGPCPQLPSGAPSARAGAC